MHTCSHEAMQADSSTHTPKTTGTCISRLKPALFPGFPASVQGTNSHRARSLQPLPASQMQSRGTCPVASCLWVLRMCPLPLEHAPTSGWLTPICPSGLHLDTPSSQKPSPILPAWIAHFSPPTALYHALSEPLACKQSEGRG